MNTVSGHVVSNPSKGHERPSLKRASAVLIAIVMAASLSACDDGNGYDDAGNSDEVAVSQDPPPHTVEAFCAVHDLHKQDYLAAFDSANASLEGGDLLGGLLEAGVALGDLNTLWKKLVEAAPEEIRVDTEIVSEGWEKMTDLAVEAVDNPLKGLGSALLNSFKLAGPLKRVDQFVRENCDDG